MGVMVWSGKVSKAMSRSSPTTRVVEDSLNWCGGYKGSVVDKLEMVIKSVVKSEWVGPLLNTLLGNRMPLAM